MPNQRWHTPCVLFTILILIAFSGNATAQSPAKIGVGAKPINGAELILDGSRKMLDEKWTYWDGPRFASELPIKWKIIDDPLDGGTVVMTDDPVAAGGKYGTADIVTKKKYRDFRLHVEFLISKPGGNSGVYLQNRYEIQVLDGDKTTHGMAAVINEFDAPYEAYNGTGKWNAYDITFRAARFENGKRSELALVSMYFNGKKVHTNVPIRRVWGGPNSGLNGDNDDDGVGITDTPGGLKLQCEGHDVRYRNIWIKELDLTKADTNFGETANQEFKNGQVIPLWNNGAPGFESRKNETEQAEDYWVKNIHNPTLTCFLPSKEKSTGAAVVVCPGGGHRLLVFNAEGVEAAEYLNEIGVAVFVLKYRLSREEGSPYDIETHALQDGQRAMRMVRSRAKEWNLDPTRIGMLGFSAGGEVVSMVSYANGTGKPKAKDAIQRLSAKPNFQILVYPGKIGIPDVIPLGSPPALLVVAEDDVGAARSIMSLIPKLRDSGIPFAAHIYARGGHAFNMGKRTPLTTLKTWPDRMRDWMQDNFVLDASGRDEYMKQVKKRQDQIRKKRDGGLK
ncbi:MAG: family 16 glycoside hydrolase [Mariniblastus sp.]